MAEITRIRLVAVDDKFFTRSRSGAIWGRIYFEIGEGQFFPNESWTDLLAAFLRAWLRVLLQSAEGNMAKNRVPFFDGPFMVDVSVSRPNVLELSFVHREMVKYSTESTVQSLLRNAVSVGEQVLLSCQERGWSNADTEVLVKLTKQGAQTLANL